MATERRVTAARLVDEHAVTRTDAHHRKIKAARAMMAAAKQRLDQVGIVRGLATMAAERQRRENQYPLASFDPWAEQHEELRKNHHLPRGRRCYRHKRVSEESRRRRGMVSRQPCRSDDGAGHPTLHCHHHQAHWELTPPAGTPMNPMKTSSFSFIYISPYYVKTIYILIKYI
jgi:hypothetical protein